MILETFLANDGLVSVLREAVERLNSINAFGLLSELGRRGNRPDRNSTNVIERFALNAAYMDGYHVALLDLFYFVERYLEVKEQVERKPDFGARETIRDDVEELFKSGGITKDDYKFYTSGISGRADTSSRG